MGGGGNSWGGDLVGKEAILGGNSSCDSLALRLRLRDRSVLTAVAFGLDITRPVGPARSYTAHLAGTTVRVRAVGLTFVQLEAKNSLDQSAY